MSDRIDADLPNPWEIVVKTTADPGDGSGGDEDGGDYGGGDNGGGTLSPGFTVLVVVVVVIIGMLLAFLWWRRRHGDEEAPDVQVAQQMVHFLVAFLRLMIRK